MARGTLPGGHAPRADLEPGSRLPVPDARYRSVDEVLRALGTTEDGLTAEEAGRRLARYGENRLVVEPPVPAWRIFLEQFRSVVVLLLLGAMLVAGVAGDFLEAAAIGAVLVINAGIGFGTELRAHRAMEALRSLGVGEAVAIRGGEPVAIEAARVVPGDVLVLDPGRSVPADGRLVHVRELQVNESALTGESVPVRKRTDPMPAEDPPEALADRWNSVFKGTVVAAGEGRMVVTATGMGTEIGRVSELVQGTPDERTPLERQLDRLGRRLVVVTLMVAAVVLVLGWARGQGFMLMLQTSLALAIAAVPEGLPAVATITLALGMRRMAARNALVRRLAAVETLGSCTVVCTDKTGTLTGGIMEVVEYALPAGTVDLRVGDPAEELAGNGGALPAQLRSALVTGLLANRARVRSDAPSEGGGCGADALAEGDPTECALVRVALAAGLDRTRLLEVLPEEGDLPFSSERMVMATAHGTDGDRLILAKGAPDRLLDRCADVLEEGWAGSVEDWEKGDRPGTSPLTGEAREAWLERAAEMGRNGLRVLGLAAGGSGRSGSGELGEEEVRGLTWLGLVGMLDPADQEVGDTIALLSRAGVRTIMITGDHQATATAIARDVGILEGGEETLEGREVSTLSDAELREAAERVAVYSRVDPEGKLRIVDALQADGEIVGMLGDGVNDAAALRSADVGVAMGIRGTDVARETADVVLLDDRLGTVAAAVEEGRVIFDNIRKFILFLFSCNLSEVLVLLVAGLLGWPLPLLPLQILWLNLLTDVLPALTLAVEPGEPGVMDRPPRDPSEAILSRSFLETIGAYALLLTGVTLGVFAMALGVLPGEETLTGSAPAASVAVTMAFTTLAFTQLAHVFNTRTRGPVIFSSKLWSNRWTLLGVGLAALLQVAAVQLPSLQVILDTVPLGWREWAVVLVASLIPLGVGQLWKAWRWRGEADGGDGRGDSGEA